MKYRIIKTTYADGTVDYTPQYLVRFQLWETWTWGDHDPYSKSSELLSFSELGAAKRFIEKRIKYDNSKEVVSEEIIPY